MARRDNQGLQIAMIVFILTTLIFLVATYFGWSSSQRWLAEATKLQSDLDTANSGLSRSESLVVTMKKLTGLAVELSNDSVETELQKAIETYGQGLPVENQNFQDIAARMSSQIQDLNRKLSQASDTEQQLRAELAQVRQTTDGLVRMAEEAKTDAVNQWNQAQQDSQETQRKLSASNRKLADDLNASNRAMTDLTAQTRDEVQTITEEMRRLKIILEQREEQIEKIQDPTPDQFDGKIAGVHAATGTVWLNVGRAHGLQPKTSFSVFDADEPNVRAAKKKASIEVIRVVDNYRAEARITDTDYVNPVVTGDFIYSPIWDKGTKLGIALVGDMDIDNDGQDDRPYIRNLIKINGARIDAEDVDGQVQGQMTVNTRYIVVGESKLDGDQQNPALVPMLNSASQLGIEQTSLNELLDLMGYAGRARSVSFRGVLRPGDFAPQPLEGVIRSSDGITSFRERSPIRRTRLPSF